LQRGRLLGTVGANDGHRRTDLSSYTPLKGGGAITDRFLREPNADRAVTTIDISDALIASMCKFKRVPIGYPHDGHATEKGSGDQFGVMRRDEERALLHVADHFRNAGFGIGGAVLIDGLRPSMGAPAAR